MLKVLPGWELNVDRGPDWLIVQVQRPKSGGINPPPLAEVLWSLAEQHFTYRLVLEFNELRVLDDSMLDQLLDLHDRIVSHGGVLRVCGLSPYNLRLLRGHPADDCLVAYDCREDAVLGSVAPHKPR